VAFFAVLPVHVEAVCWAMGRKDMLAALFMLTGLLCQTAELESESSQKRWTFRALVLVSTVCALLSKASSVAFVLVLALHRLFQGHVGNARRAAPSSGEPLKNTLLAMLAPLVVTVAFFIWYHGILSAWGVIESDSPGPTNPIHLEKVVTFLPLIFGRYVFSLLGLVEFSMFYRWPHVAIPLSSLELLGSALIAVTVVVGLGVLWRRRPDLAFYVLAGLALLAPYTGLQYVGFWAADRYLYLASGFALAAVVIPMVDFARRQRTARIAFVTLGVCLLLVLGARTWQQQSVWRNNEALWSYEAYRQEPSLLSIQALAKHHLKRAQAETDPARRQAWVQRTRVEIDRGFARYQELGLQPSPYKVRETFHHARLHYLRGRVRQLEGAPIGEQLVHHRRAFEIAPDRLTAMMLSSGLFEMANRETEAATRQRLYEESFDAFMAFVEMGHRDARRLAQSRELLARNYEGRFPFLRERIAEAKRVYFQ